MKADAVESDNQVHKVHKVDYSTLSLGVGWGVNNDNDNNNNNNNNKREFAPQNPFKAVPPLQPWVSFYCTLIINR